MVSNPDHRRIVKLNVGGKLFETTEATLRSAGPESFLHALSLSTSDLPIFIDRDPHLFKPILSLLRRSIHIPSSVPIHVLSREAAYYGVDSLLRAAASPPPFSGIDASPVRTVCPSTDPVVSTFDSDGSVWISHAGLVSAYDWALSHTSTIRTHINHISSLRSISPEIAAIGSTASPGLHFYNVSGDPHKARLTSVTTGDHHVGSVNWTDPSDPRVHKARVTSITTGVGVGVFAAVECPHKENCILEVDKETLKVRSEIGRQSGSSTRTAAATRLAWLGKKNVLFSSAVNVGAFGYSGYIRMWDPRTGKMVWETAEPGSGRSSGRFGDSLSDADVDLEDDVGKIYKVCWKSGDVAVADVRMLGEDPWFYFESVGGRKGGSGEGSVLCCYRKQVFVSRNDGGLDLEVWSSSADGGGYRRNMVEEGRRSAGDVIRRMEGGGNRLFVSRGGGGMEGVEVWETSYDSNPIFLSSD